LALVAWLNQAILVTFLQREVTAISSMERADNSCCSVIESKQCRFTAGSNGILIDECLCNDNRIVHSERRSNVYVRQVTTVMPSEVLRYNEGKHIMQVEGVPFI